MTTRPARRPDHPKEDLPIALSLITTLSSAAVIQDPVNKIVLVLDSSGSFKNRQAEAVKRSVQLLEALSATKLKRWETETDQVAIVALDSMPEVIWNGTGKELKEADGQQWAARFAARKNMSGCTDLTKAVTLALAHLDGDPRFVSKYLIVFSDLIHEPPTSSLKTCAKCQYAPPAGFPWDALEGISVSVFGLPDEQKFTWSKAVEQHGLSHSFAMFTTEQSSVEKIAPPPRPLEKVSEAQETAERQEFKQDAFAWLKFTAIIAGALIGLPVLLLVIRNLIASRRPQRRAQPTAVPFAAAGGQRSPGRVGGAGPIPFPGRRRQ
jgi:hypothetical protein